MARRIREYAKVYPRVAGRGELHNAPWPGTLRSFAIMFTCTANRGPQIHPRAATNKWKPREKSPGQLATKHLTDGSGYCV
jgi:hypothetical protein